MQSVASTALSVAGNGQSVLVVGSVGSGKAFLVQLLQRRAIEHGISWFSFACNHSAAAATRSHTIDKLSIFSHGLTEALSTNSFATSPSATVQPIIICIHGLHFAREEDIPVIQTVIDKVRSHDTGRHSNAKVKIGLIVTTDAYLLHNQSESITPSAATIPAVFASIAESCHLLHMQEDNRTDDTEERLTTPLELSADDLMPPMGIVSIISNDESAVGNDSDFRVMRTQIAPNRSLYALKQHYNAFGPEQCALLLQADFISSANLHRLVFGQLDHVEMRKLIVHLGFLLKLQFLTLSPACNCMSPPAASTNEGAASHEVGPSLRETHHLHGVLQIVQTESEQLKYSNAVSGAAFSALGKSVQQGIAFPTANMQQMLHSRSATDTTDDDWAPFPLYQIFSTHTSVIATNSMIAAQRLVVAKQESSEAQTMDQEVWIEALIPPGTIGRQVLLKSLPHAARVICQAATQDVSASYICVVWYTSTCTKLHRYMMDEQREDQSPHLCDTCPGCAYSIVTPHVFEVPVLPRSSQLLQVQKIATQPTLREGFSVERCKTNLHRRNCTNFKLSCFSCHGRKSTSIEHNVFIEATNLQKPT